VNELLHRHGTKILMLCAIGAWWIGVTKGRTLPAVERIDQRILQQPVQDASSKEAFNVLLGDRPYRVQPRFNYDIHGLVVSEHHSDSLLDFYHRMTGDFLNVCDLAMVWGVNAKSGIYQKGKFHNQDFTAWVQYDDDERVL
jgi:hypothetical protein